MFVFIRGQTYISDLLSLLLLQCAFLLSLLFSPKFLQDVIMFAKCGVFHVLVYLYAFSFKFLIIVCYSANKLNLEAEEIWKNTLWKFVFSKGHSVSVLPRPGALLSAVPNWPLVSCSWCEWSSSCICLSPRPSKALVSSEKLWVYFQIKCHLLAPISADKCPQSQVGGRLGPKSTKQQRLLKRAKGFIFFLSTRLSLTDCLSFTPNISPPLWTQIQTLRNINYERFIKTFTELLPSTGAWLILNFWG